MKTNHSAPRLGWWKCCTIYQIYPRSFQDSEGDGVGDLPGLLSRAELERAGCNGVIARELVAVLRRYSLNMPNTWKTSWKR
ncbi:hypothetical protein [Ensifer aridi]|uniref:alpha-amylase family glycosyl hydrolase n=1 Tax=Ensifer aridi TaxID=1708715 RepID=UPI00111C3CF6|nr:hypothetical protein [Ensifer aridi]